MRLEHVLGCIKAGAEPSEAWQKVFGRISAARWAAMVKQAERIQMNADHVETMNKEAERLEAEADAAKEAGRDDKELRARADEYRKLAEAHASA